MKNHRTLLGIVLLVLAGTLQRNTACTLPVSEASVTDPEPLVAQSEWHEFSSRAGGFSVLMPGTPKEETEVKELPVVGKGVTHLFILATESGVFVAGYVDIPGLAQQSQSFCDSFGKGFLRTIGEATAKGAAGKVVKETDILFGKDPGKEILIETPTTTATARVYFINRRGYELIAAPPASNSDPGSAKKFLDSFRVIAR